MKQKCTNGQARLFSKALLSALGSASLPRKDHVASKENFLIAQTAPTTDLPNMCKNTEVMSPGFDILSQRDIYGNGSVFSNHGQISSSHLCLENNHLSAIQENWALPETKFTEDMPPSFQDPNQLDIKGNEYSLHSNYVEINSLLPNQYDPHPWVGNNHFSAIRGNYGLPETKYDEVVSPSYEYPNQVDTNHDEYSLPSSHVVETSPSSDLQSWLENHRMASIQETLNMVSNNDNDVWIKKNRLMALQQLGNNSRGQYSSNLSPVYSFDSTKETSPVMMYNPSDNQEYVFSPQSSSDSLSSGSNSLKGVPVCNSKYKFEKQERPLIYQHEEMKSELYQEKNFSKDQLSPIESFNFPYEEQPVSVGAELAVKNTNQSSEKSYLKIHSQLENLQVKTLESESSTPNCCETFYDKQSNRNKRNVAKLPRYDASTLMTLESTTGFYDSHCHIDILFTRENFYGTYGDYMAQHRGSYPKSYNGCVAVFCKPLMFSKKHIWMKHLEQDNVWGAFGCHPKSAKFYDGKVEKDLETALNHPKVKALGEIGLDYSKGNRCSKLEQHYVFKRQLNIAKKRNLRVVIHCRDADDDAIKIMHEVLPKDTIFHLHCFTGTWKRAQIWMNEFPNVFIGITNLVTFPSATETHEVARKMPLDHLLLETDAPYFVPHMTPKGTRASHPGMAIHVAAQIAALKDIPVETVLNWTSANTKLVYNIT